MGIFGKLFGTEQEMTDDEKELRNYEENVYMAESGVADGTYSEFVVNDSFRIKDRLTITGRVNTGVFHVGDKIEVVHKNNVVIEGVILGLEQFKTRCTKISENDNAAMYISSNNPTDYKLVKRNDIIKKV